MKAGRQQEQALKCRLVAPQDGFAALGDTQPLGKEFKGDVAGKPFHPQHSEPVGKLLLPQSGRLKALVGFCAPKEEGIVVGTEHHPSTCWRFLFNGLGIQMWL